MYIYGSISLALAAVWPAVWLLVQKDLSEWNTVGWKMNAYVHLFIWGPMFLIFLCAWIFQDIWAYLWVYHYANFTMAGPYFLQIFVIFYIFLVGSTQNTWYQWLAAVGYTLYTGVLMFYQYALIPPIQAYYYNKLLIRSIRRGERSN